MKKKLFPIILIALNILFFTLTVVTDALYIKNGNPYKYKVLASAVFVCWSLINVVLVFAFKKMFNKPFTILMFVGQIFAMLGDILLIDHFIVGAALFAVCHLFFMASYMFIEKFKKTDLLFMLGVIVVSALIIVISKVNLGNKLILIMLYATVISCMLGKNLTLFKGNKIIASCIFVGSLMFYLSDMFLMFGIFDAMTKGGFWCLFFYYPAEFVLASSIGISGYINSKQQN